MPPRSPRATRPLRRRIGRPWARRGAVSIGGCLPLARAGKASTARRCRYRTPSRRRAPVAGRTAARVSGSPSSGMRRAHRSHARAKAPAHREARRNPCPWPGKPEASTGASGRNVAAEEDPQILVFLDGRDSRTRSASAGGRTGAPGVAHAGDRVARLRQGRPPRGSAAGGPHRLAECRGDQRQEAIGCAVKHALGRLQRRGATSIGEPCPDRLSPGGFGLIVELRAEKGGEVDAGHLVEDCRGASQLGEMRRFEDVACGVEGGPRQARWSRAVRARGWVPNASAAGRLGGTGSGKDATRWAA